MIIIHISLGGDVKGKGVDGEAVGVLSANENSFSRKTTPQKSISFHFQDCKPAIPSDKTDIQKG